MVFLARAVAQGVIPPGNHEMFNPVNNFRLGERTVERVMKRRPVVMSTKTTGLYWG